MGSGWESDTSVQAESPESPQQAVSVQHTANRLVFRAEEVLNKWLRQELENQYIRNNQG